MPIVQGAGASAETGNNIIGQVKITNGSLVASILDLTNSDPLAVAIVDTNGDQISSFGGGTQYTEDAAAAANPVGTALNLIRADTPAGITTTDGDNVAARGTDYGALYVTLLDTSGSAVSVGGGTQYDEDTASANAQKLTMAGVTRADTAASQVDTDGDRSTLIVDASGRLHVNVGNTVTVGSHAVTNAGTFAVQVDGSALTALQLIDDIVLAEDAAHQTGDKGVMALAVRQDSQSDFGADGDYVPFSIDGDGALRVAIISGAGSGGTASADDADFTAGSTSGTPAMGVYESSPTSVTDGDMGVVGITQTRALRVSIDNASIAVTATNLDVQSGGADLATTTQAGAIQTAVEIMDDWDESDRAKVNLIVGQAGIAAGNGASGVTVPRVTIANDSTGVLATVSTVSSVTQVRPPDIDVTGHTNYARKYYTSAGSVTDGIVWSPASGKRWHVCALWFQVSAACTVTFEDDKAGGDDPVLKGEFAANSGAYLVFPEKYPMASGEDAADLLVTTSAGNIYVMAVGYEI